jgi:hypothetical protein
MSILKVQVNEDHLKLLKHLRWSLTSDKYIISKGEDHDADENKFPFGGDSFYEGINIILNGKPTNFDPFNSDEPEVYSPEQIAKWDKLYSELPMVLDVILYNQEFKIGTFVSNYQIRDWKRIS